MTSSAGLRPSVSRGTTVKLFGVGRRVQLHVSSRQVREAHFFDELRIQLLRWLAREVRLNSVFANVRRCVCDSGISQTSSDVLADADPPRQGTLQQFPNGSVIGDTWIETAGLGRERLSDLVQEFRDADLCIGIVRHEIT